MQILWFEELESTQIYLKQELKDGNLASPVAIVANKQTAGVGSRGNGWIGMEGNLFFSFSVSKNSLPSDLPLESASIYFSYLLKESFLEFGSKVWLKWPNDFYLKNRKIGGCVTFLLNNNLLCGIGINLVNAPNGFDSLDIKIDKEVLLKKFFKKLEKKILWKQVFSKYKIEFTQSKNYSTHDENGVLSLKKAKLNSDGSLSIDGQRIYSLR